MRRIPGTDIDISAVGQGTWGFGESRERRTREVDALRLGISLGMTLIDTAEFYGGGGSEKVVADAIADCRGDVFVVTKVWPSHASAEEFKASVAASLKRLCTDHLDAILLHWPTNAVPIEETLRAMEELRQSGAVRFYGVSNFPRRRMDSALAAVPAGGRITFNQVQYSLGNRKAENLLLEGAHREGHLIMAYSPLAHGRYASWSRSPALQAVAARHEADPTEIAVAWAARDEAVVAIPKATSPEHVRANARAGDIVLSEQDLRELDGAFPRAAGDISVPLPPFGFVHRMVLSGARMMMRGGGREG